MCVQLGGGGVTDGVCISVVGEGLKKAYDSPNRYYQHRNKLFVAGTKDFPQDHLDDLTLPYGNTLKSTKRGNDVEAYYRNHMTEIDAVIGHSLGGSVSLALKENIETIK